MTSSIAVCAKNSVQKTAMFGASSQIICAIPIPEILTGSILKKRN